MLEDMLGVSAKVPKFVKRYGNLGQAIEAAVRGFLSRFQSTMKGSPMAGRSDRSYCAVDTCQLE